MKGPAATLIQLTVLAPDRGKLSSLVIVSFCFRKRNTVGVYVGKGVKGISFINFEGTDVFPMVFTAR